MTATCPNPPALDEMGRAELDRVIGKPLCCASCGGELELRCAAGHLHVAPKTKSPNGGTAPHGKVRQCDAGHRLPPFKSRCLICRPLPVPKYRIEDRRSPGPRARLRFVCGETFTPTGPNSKRCEGCRGSA